MVLIQELPTPLVIVDLDKLELNINEVAKEAKKSGKKLFPMVKTHKSVILPPLVLTKELADKGIDAFEAALKSIEHKLL